MTTNDCSTYHETHHLSLDEINMIAGGKRVTLTPFSNRVISLERAPDAKPSADVHNIDPVSGIHRLQQFRIVAHKGQTAVFNVPLYDTDEKCAITLFVFDAQRADNFKVIQDGIVSHSGRLDDLVSIMKSRGVEPCLPSFFKLVFNRPRFKHLVIEFDINDGPDGNITIYREVNPASMQHVYGD